MPAPGSPLPPPPPRPPPAPAPPLLPSCGHPLPRRSLDRAAYTGPASSRPVAPPWDFGTGRPLAAPSALNRSPRRRRPAPGLSFPPGLRAPGLERAGRPCLRAPAAGGRPARSRRVRPGRRAPPRPLPSSPRGGAHPPSAPGPMQRKRGKSPVSGYPGPPVAGWGAQQGSAHRLVLAAAAWKAPCKGARPPREPLSSPPPFRPRARRRRRPAAPGPPPPLPRHRARRAGRRASGAAWR